MYLALLLVPWAIRDQVLRVGRRLYHGSTSHARGDSGRPLTLRS
jgi:hypothetical protein